MESQPLVPVPPSTPTATNPATPPHRKNPTMVAADRPRILFVATEDWFFYLHRLALARAIRDVGCHVIVASPAGAFRSHFAAEGFAHYPLILRRRGNSPLREALSLLDLVACYQLTRPDLIHHISMKPILYGSMAAQLVRAPAVVNAVTGLGYVFTPGPWRHTLLRHAVEWSYRIGCWRPRLIATFENPDDYSMFIKKRIISPAQAVLIPGVGVETDRFLPAPEPLGDPVILLAARLIWDKGVAEYVEAARLLKQRGIPCRILLAGIPDHSNPAAIPEEQLHAWHESGIIEWIGHQRDMPTLIAQSHIVCLPSRYREGIPVSLLEAASCARPIVTTDMPGCREIVRHNWNGLLVPIQDPPALADALEYLLRDAALRRVMGARGRELVEQKFAQHIINQKTFAVYQQLLGDRWPK